MILAQATLWTTDQFFSRVHIYVGLFIIEPTFSISDLPHLLINSTNVSQDVSGWTWTQNQFHLRLEKIYQGLGLIVD